ncbi:hypothetical protein CAPTEDRAFT_194969 [Capitella teleta]|uniref:Uncharacterized protein n=1 Tax=Capitella teleta TaxID=283909 RepID=R7VGU6_CAPTE|nr:hypothetical protein CAPTEDRAFT_194969 [Capitella teleta]|eukprot:ELU17829.1 hypothetical protein CAPTEDRAFT_194969 [Capitella teleta]
MSISAVGCPDLNTAPNVWMTRDGRALTVGCNKSKQTWHLVCEGNTWIGVIGNCTTERCGEYVLSTFLAEKIDYQVFLETPPEQLEELVPAYGDRLAASNKARRMVTSSCNSRETASTSMLARLKRKNAEHPGTSKKSLNMKGNRIAVKKDLRFELGLMKCTGNPSNPFKQVRSSQGGGTRHLTADRNTKIGEIHEIAQNVFFPEGYSRQGYLKNFSTTMRDVNGIEIPCSSSIHEQYHERKPFPFDDDPPTLADQPLPLDDHSLIGGAQPSEEQSLKIKLHRGHVFEKLNEAFQNNPAMKCPSMCLTIEMVLPNGIVEMGQDTGGILHDALSEYWSTFKEKCTTGVEDFWRRMLPSTALPL